MSEQWLCLAWPSTRFVSLSGCQEAKVQLAAEIDPLVVGWDYGYLPLDPDGNEKGFSTMREALVNHIESINLIRPSLTRKDEL